MIHFNSSASLFGANNIDGAKSQQASATDSSSFDSELSEAIASALQQLGINPNQVNISITPNNTPSTATPSTPTSTAPTTTTPTTTTPAASEAAAAASSPVTTPAVTVASTASTTPATTQESYDEQYWADQPAAIQQLQTIEDPTERSMMAGQLAAEGYQIDVPIMAWGWDPSSTMALRQDFGYTWVPSGYQSPVQEAPGMQVPGLTPYDPNNPPPGSIAVS